MRPAVNGFAPVLVAVVMSSVAASGQTPPPVRGTVAPDGSMKKFYRAANAIIVTTVDGVDHVYRFTKDLIVHGGKGAGPDALEGLREGSTVVVHYAAAGEEEAAREVDLVDGAGLQTTEGMVTRIDRRRGQITVRYDHGKTEIFSLTERVATEATGDRTQTGTRAVIYYSDEAGRKVAHFFKKIS